MKIFFSSPHGNYRISKWQFEQTLREICIQNRIPFQSMSFYGEKDSKMTLIVGLHLPLGRLVDLYDLILIKADRNIDYLSCVNRGTKVKTAAEPVSEYTFPSEGSEEFHHFEFSQDDCRKYVIGQVTEFLQKDVAVDSRKKIVLGISGGGDSNTLIMSFLESGLVKKNQIIAVMMLGIPDWDKGKPRAEFICKEHDIELRFIEEDMVNQLLGRKVKKDWVEDFEKKFPDADLEILGTLGIRLSLCHVAKETGAQAAVTGINLEDMLAECLLRVMKGKLPPPFPVRPIDDLAFWHPLYRIPKKIIDGCYPKYSLQNYNDRFPSRMLGRAIPYYLAQCLHGIMPGIEFDLLKGFKELSKLNGSYGFFDSKLNFSTVEPVSEKLRQDWEKFVACD